MPKKFNETQKTKWLKFYETGKTEKWIAHQSNCDVRTVRKAIQEVRWKEDFTFARRELVKDALRHHQDSLLGEIDLILSKLAVPEQDLAVLSWYHKGDSVFMSPEDTNKSQTADLEKTGLSAGGEDNVVRRLLKQHLKNDKLWNVLVRWEKAYAAHLATRAALQRRTVSLLEEKTGYHVLDGEGVKPYVISYTTSDLFFKTALTLAFGASDKSAELERVMKELETTVTANEGSRDVRYDGGYILAETDGNGQAVKRNLLDAFKSLAESPEIKPVIETYHTLEEITGTARQIVEQIKLLGLVPGQCDICRRLGM